MLILSILFMATAQADYGMFMVVKGDVKVQDAKNQINAAKVGLKVAVGDTIISAVDSRAKIVMSDRNVISISPSTKIKIEKYQTGENKNVELKLTQGKVRNTVEQTYDGEKTKFLIKTPTAVAGVRGTEFVTSFDAKTKVTEVVTLKGQVALSNPITLATVMVNKGEESSMKKDQAPSAPKPAQAETLKSLTNEFSETKDKGNDKKETTEPKTDQKDKAKDKDAKEQPKDQAKDQPKEKTKEKVDSRDLQPGGPTKEDGSLMPPAPPPAPPQVMQPPPPPPRNLPTSTRVKVVPTTDK
ncbi:MAG: FecR domain-containing protein [Bdellovibrionaceae bacterium]|nr:FecR domain-containing protein [Bdellovibrio sp.]